MESTTAELQDSLGKEDPEEERRSSL